MSAILPINLMQKRRLDLLLVLIATRPQDHTTEVQR
jgi:hypothetical protein